MSRPKNKAKVPCWIFKVKAMHWKPKGKAKKFLKFKLPEMDGYGKSTVKFSSPFFIAVHCQEDFRVNFDLIKGLGEGVRQVWAS